jgi:hypothetical protein
MAKHIEATPILRGKEASEFIRKMALKEHSKITKKEKEMFASIMFMEDGETPRCPHCGDAMTNVRIKGKPNRYLWRCKCHDFPKGIILSVG